MKESKINNPANPQICRRWEVQRKRIAAGVSHPRGGDNRKCESAQNGKILRCAQDDRRGTCTAFFDISYPQSGMKKAPPAAQAELLWLRD